MNIRHADDGFNGRIRRNWQRVGRNLKRFLVILVLVAIFATLFFFHRMFINIEAGQGGVLWKRFSGGTELTHLYTEGFHFVAPWNKMAIYDLRIQQVPHDFAALSKEGLPITVELSIRYRPVAKELPVLHQNIGANYVEKVVKPEVQAQVRFVLAQYSPEEIYTSEGFLLQIITQGAFGKIAERHILLDDLLIKRLVLPNLIAEAIERKLVQEQLVLEYEYRLQREEKEAERKRIEAEGIRDFQTEVMRGGAFDKYLRFFGVSATVELAASNNAKMVVIGGGSDGLPLILNMPDTPSPAFQPETTGPVNELPDDASHFNRALRPDAGQLGPQAQHDPKLEASPPDNRLRSLLNLPQQP